MSRPRAMKVCSVPGCPALTMAGRCDDHKRAAERARGSAAARGYGHQHEVRFRVGVLGRYPTCQCATKGHGHPGQCGARSTVADHHPLSRRQLVRFGLDPNDPRHGRGLCKPCHDKHTAAAQPGGFNA